MAAREKMKPTADILKFWHQVEFFVPFNLEEVRSGNAKIYELSEEQLERGGNMHLPWLSTQGFNQAGGDPACQYAYNLYLLPFGKNEITKISKKIFPVAETSFSQIEFEEKLDDIGDSCFAKLKINSQGKPDFSALSFSTLPWALGLLTARRFNEINFATYEKDQQKLKTALNNLKAHVDNVHSALITDHSAPGSLTAQGLRALFNVLRKWANFSPSYKIDIVIELVKVFQDQKKLTHTIDSEAVLSEKNISQISLEPQFDILNSFYIEDIEKVANQTLGNKHEALDAYIGGIPVHKKIDLYLRENKRHIRHKLQPEYLNHGRWPAEDKHFMSLMQQLAINECFYPAGKNPLFSVNGPPGTGKTTMLQDIIAENIVQRARVLSQFQSAVSVFKGRQLVNFTGNESRSLRILDKRLTGFEMIVVSSNNAAVENISKDLPLKRKLAQKYQTGCTYLRPIASKAFAEHKNNRVIPLSAENAPWGLISVALGNSKNKQKFFKQAFLPPENKEDAKVRAEKGEYLTFWEWG